MAEKQCRATEFYPQGMSERRWAFVDFRDKANEIIDDNNGRGYESIKSALEAGCYKLYSEKPTTSTELRGNVDEMFVPIKDGEEMPDIHFYLNWQCANPKCGTKYGTQPSICIDSRCQGNKFIQIKPEYQSLMAW